MSKLVLWGTSIGKGVVYDEHRRRYALAKDRCANVMTAAGLQVENHARMGATIRDGMADLMETETHAGDIAVLEYGGNDCDLDWQAVSDHPDIRQEGKTPLAAFQELLNEFIRRVRARGMQPVLVNPPPLLSHRYYEWVSQNRDADAIARYLGDIENIARWHERYARVIERTARLQRCPLADFRGLFLDQPHMEDFICLDGIHPNENGQRLMGQHVCDALLHPHTGECLLVLPDQNG